MEFVFVYILFAILIGVWAAKLNRSVILGILGAIFFSPLIVGIYYLIVGQANTKKCPHCTEMVNQEAKVCRFCGKELKAVAA